MRAVGGGEEKGRVEVGDAVGVRRMDCGVLGTATRDGRVFAARPPGIDRISCIVVAAVILVSMDEDRSGSSSMVVVIDPPSCDRREAFNFRQRYFKACATLTRATDSGTSIQTS